MLRHKTRPKSSSDLGKIKHHTGFISVTLMLDGSQSGPLHKELDVPHWTHSQGSGPKESPALPGRSWKKRDEERCFREKTQVSTTKAVIQCTGSHMWAGSS